MSYRDLTRDYIDVRSRYTKPLSPEIGGYDSSEDDYEISYMNPKKKQKQKKNRHDNNSGDIELGDTFNDQQQPKYVLVLNGVQDAMSNIKNDLVVLKKLHETHTTFRVGQDFAEEERRVQNQTSQIKEQFLACKKAVEIIKPPEKPKTEEQLMLRNLKISLVNELNDLSKVFRDEQSEYLKNMERLKAKKRDNKVNYEETDYSDLEPEQKRRIMELEQKLQADPSFTDDQIKQMLENEQDIIRRDKELREILASIVELNELFKEFSALVVEQGTLIDRIDYNIETSLESVRAGNVDLGKAEQYQKMSRTTLFILLLIILVVAFTLFFALKLVLRFTAGGGILAFL